MDTVNVFRSFTDVQDDNTDVQDDNWGKEGGIKMKNEKKMINEESIT